MPYDEQGNFHWTPEEAMDVYADMRTGNELAPPPPGSRRPALLDILGRYYFDPNQLIFAETSTSPVYIPFDEPSIGPLLITGPAGSGKTELLQVFAKSVNLCHPASSVKFCILTNQPKEWESVENMPHNLGMYPLYSRSSEEMLLSLASHAHEAKTHTETILLLIDNLEEATNLDFEARQNLRWLLLRGPARRVWPATTYDMANAHEMQPWLDAFKTYLVSKDTLQFALKNPTGESEAFYVPRLT